jgi:hypothetical protein
LEAHSVYEPKLNILEEAIRKDIQIICFLNSLMNKIVYDMMEPSPYTKDINPKDYDIDVLPYYIPNS